MTDATNETTGNKRRTALPLPVIGIIAGVVVVALIAAGVFYAVKRSSVPTLEEAKKAYESGDLAGAEEKAQAIVENDPQDVAARSLLADALRDQGKSDDAIEQYSEIVKAKPKDDKALYELAVLERQAGNPQEALKHFDAAADITGDALYLDEYARTCMQVGKFEEAIAAWKKVLEDQGLETQKRAETLGALAQAYQDAKLYEEAKQALRDALAIMPEDPNLKARLEALGG